MIDSFTTTTSFGPADLESLKAILAKIPPSSRDVFRFDGTREELERDLRRAGVTIVPGGPEAGRASPWPLHAFPIGGLSVMEIDGAIWIGSTRDIDDARSGKLAFMIISGAAR